MSDVSDIATEIMIIEPALTLDDIEFSLDEHPSALTINYQDKEIWFELPVLVRRLMLIEDSKFYVGDEITMSFPGDLIGIVTVKKSSNGWADLLAIGAERDDADGKKTLFMEVHVGFEDIKFKTASLRAAKEA